MINHLEISGSTFLEQVLRRIWVGGWTGVDLFFVLSGFLVSGLVFKEYKSESSFDPKRFLIRRGFKIYPAYYLFLFTAFTLRYILTPTHTVYNSAEGLLNESVFISNYLRYNNPWLWSICVEEHFYFFLAIALWLLITYKHLRFRNLLVIYLLFLCVGLFFRVQNYFQYSDYNFDRDYSRSHLRFDSLFFGVLLSYIWNFKPSYIQKITSGKIILLIGSLVFISCNFIFPRPENRWIPVVNLSLNPIFFGYILIFFLEYKKERPFLRTNILATIGKYSYCIYLFHGFVNHVIKHFFSGYIYYILYFSISIAVGIIVSKVIEYPSLRFRDKFFPSKSKVALLAK
jgi:peptidoglycan/LPS O-acetylase OafA/YrhL